MSLYKYQDKDKIISGISNDIIKCLNKTEDYKKSEVLVTNIEELLKEIKTSGSESEKIKNKVKTHKDSQCEKLKKEIDESDCDIKEYPKLNYCDIDNVLKEKKGKCTSSPENG